MHLIRCDVTASYEIIGNGGELDRKLETMLRNRKRCLHNLLGPTWLRSAIAEITQWCNIT